MWYYSICGLLVPPSVPKLRTPLATIFVEIFFQKKFWQDSGPISSTYNGRNFQYLKKLAFWNFSNESSFQVNSVVHGWCHNVYQAQTFNHLLKTGVSQQIIVWHIQIIPCIKSSLTCLFINKSYLFFWLKIVEKTNFVKGKKSNNMFWSKASLT